ncbi:MAG: nucleotidyltransferase domain-containing protein [Nanoarchaeota archaeon]|nr:nucleotidyltransferase domain-containing protein [Nanoarchaeota archaeon]MBU4283751.1 nucleotidyltransferase domain-containing protein [Nanoarchaeota archaeon]
MKQLAKKLKNLLKNKKIIDLVIFGSVAKNKIRASDIDIAVILKDSIDKNNLKESIGKLINKKIHLQLVSINDYDKFLWLTLIKEGYSIKHNKYLFELYKIKPIVLFKYNLKQLPTSKKVMFERAIKNFKDIEKLSNRVVLVPINLSGEFADFLRNWNIDIDAQEYMLLPLLRKGEDQTLVKFPNF